MKEFELKNEPKIEISVKQKKQIEYEFIGQIRPHSGHTLWQINNVTLEIEKARFNNTTYNLNEELKKEIILMKDHTYISALNKKNALKKYKQGTNGSKQVIENPLSFF